MKRFILIAIALLMLSAPLGAVGTAHAQVATGGSTYVSLGDSVAAGLGLPAVANPTSTDTTCGRSSQAYNTIVAKAAGLPLVTAACSGATAGDLFTKQSVGGTSLPAQITTAYGAGKPQLITITAGANDAHWASFIKACYSYTCGSRAYTYASDAYLYALKLKLYVAFSAIQLKSGNNPPPTYITGYYNPVSAACSQLTASLTPAEINWISTQTDALNQTIASVAQAYSFVKYVPIDFTGHDLCSSRPWIQDLSATAPLHPTATGQRAIANAIVNAL